MILFPLPEASSQVIKEFLSYYLKLDDRVQIFAENSDGKRIVGFIEWLKEKNNSSVFRKE